MCSRDATRPFATVTRSMADAPEEGTTQTRAAAPVSPFCDPFCDEDQQPIQASQRGSALGVCALAARGATSATRTIQTARVRPKAALVTVRLNEDTTAAQYGASSNARRSCPASLA